MPRYNVYGVVTGTKFLGEFEADSPEDAIEMATDEASVSLCHQCDKEVDGAEIHKIEAELIP